MVRKSGARRRADVERIMSARLRFCDHLGGATQTQIFAHICVLCRVRLVFAFQHMWKL